MPRNFLRLADFALALGEVVVVGQLQRLVDDAGEIAAVVGVAIGVLNGIAEGGMRFFLRRRTGSMPMTRAASSTTRSSA